MFDKIQQMKKDGYSDEQIMRETVLEMEKYIKENPDKIMNASLKEANDVLDVFKENIKNGTN